MLQKTLPNQEVPAPEIRRRRFRRNAVPYVLVSPVMLFMVAALIYPLVFSLLIAFKKYDFASGLNVFKMSWAGLQNFSLLFTDPVFLSSMKVTALLLLVALPAQLILGFGLALAVNSLTGNRLSRLYSTAILVPLMLPAIAASLVWKMLLNTQYGFINNLSQALNLGSHDFLGNPTGAVTSLIVVDIWQWTPFVFLLLLAGLKSLPVEVFEAAEIDGCNGVKKFRYVTFPMMGWIVLLVVLLRGADLMRLFDYSYGLTFGGPGYATETMSFYAYLKGFQDFQLDRGAAASWILFLVVYGGSLLIFSTRRAKEAWS